MKKSIIGILVIIGIVILGMIIFSGAIGNYFFLGSFSTSCGDEFNNAFKEAVKSNDINFCNNFNGEIKYPAKDPKGDEYFCSIPETKYGIEELDFKDSCLGAMAYSIKDIEFCKLIKGETSKGSCVLGIARDKGDISYCEILEKTNAYYGPCIGDNDYVAPQNPNQSAHLA